MQPCGTEFDLMWVEGGVFIMRERGVVKLIFVTSLSDQIVDVCWDGENIWVALEETGVRVLSTDGELRAHLRFGHELPPVGKGTDFKSNVGLHPVAPGRCLVLGRMGPEIRNWIALARQSPTADHQGGPAFSATVIHTATKRAIRGTIPSTKSTARGGRPNTRNRDKRAGGCC